MTGQTSIRNPGNTNIFSEVTKSIDHLKYMIGSKNPNSTYQQDATASRAKEVINKGIEAAYTTVSNSESSSGSGITSQEQAGQNASNGGSGGSYNGTGTGTGTGTSTGTGGTTSPLLEGSMTFEELIGEICNGIDLLFICKRSTVVVTDYEGLYAEAKYLRDNYHTSVKAEDIALWQLEEGTYELDVNEYGFYNTVIVEYKNGTIKESYDDLVRVYGEVPITYEEKKIDKSTAIMKAKAYLAAHVRDFDMSVKANLLHDADIDIGDIVTLENPMTMRNQYRQDHEGRDPEYLFVMGNSISWEGETPITNSIELRYGAKSPERKEVPETGASYSGTGSSSPQTATTTQGLEAAINEVGQMAEKISYSGACQTHDCVKSQGTGDCHGMSDFIACELEARGISTQIRQYGTSYAGNHRSVLYKDLTNQWQRFPYRSFNIDMRFRDTDGISSSSEIGKTCGGG